jgi:hypothetical protein
LAVVLKGPYEGHEPLSFSFEGPAPSFLRRDHFDPGDRMSDHNWEGVKKLSEDKDGGRRYGLTPEFSFLLIYDKGVEYNLE